MSSESILRQENIENELVNKQKKKSKFENLLFFFPHTLEKKIVFVESLSQVTKVTEKSNSSVDEYASSKQILFSFLFISLRMGEVP